MGLVIGIVLSAALMSLGWKRLSAVLAVVGAFLMWFLLQKDWSQAPSENTTNNTACTLPELKYDVAPFRRDSISPN